MDMQEILYKEHIELDKINLDNITLWTLGDISTSRGVHVRANYVMIPKKFYKVMLMFYPELLDKVQKFFEYHTKAECVIITGLYENN